MAVLHPGCGGGCLKGSVNKVTTVDLHAVMHMESWVCLVSYDKVMHIEVGVMHRESWVRLVSYDKVKQTLKAPRL